MNKLEQKKEAESYLVHSEPPPSAATPKGKRPCSVKIKPGTVRLVDGDLSFEGYADGDERRIPIVVMSVEHSEPIFRKIRSKAGRLESILGLLPTSDCEALASRLQGLSQVTFSLDE